jgi:hypothetical protein
MHCAQADLKVFSSTTLRKWAWAVPSRKTSFTQPITISALLPDPTLKMILLIAALVTPMIGSGTPAEAC